MKQTLTIILLITSLAATAQVSLLGGLNYSSLYGKTEPDKKAKYGPRVGVMINAGHLQLTSTYTSKGVMINRNQDPATGKYASDRWSFNLNYAQQTAALTIGSGWFTAQLGAYGSYLIDARLQSTFWPRQSAYPSNTFKRFDYGPLAGVSVDLHGASLHVSYERGLAKLNPAGYVHEHFQNECAVVALSIPLIP